jgi:hypothetical protein
MPVEPLGIEMDLDAMFGHQLNVDVTLLKLRLHCLCFFNTAPKAALTLA